MDAALKLQESRHPGKQAVPAGIFYYHIDDPVIDREDGMTDEEIEAGILRKLRMNGLVNSSLDVIRHMDREIEKESDVIPVALKDGYVQELKSSVAGGKRFAHLTDYVTRSSGRWARRSWMECGSGSLQAGEPDGVRLLSVPQCVWGLI